MVKKGILEKLFSGLCRPYDDSDTKKSLDDLVSNSRYITNLLTSNVFTDEFHAIYAVIERAVKFNAVPTPDLFAEILSNNIDTIYNDNMTQKGVKKPDAKIDFYEYSDSDDENEIKADFIKHCTAVYDKLSKKTITSADFILTYSVFLNQYKEEKMQEHLANANAILAKGLFVNRAFYKGFADATKYLNLVNAELSALSPTSNASSIITSGEEGLRVKRLNENKTKRIPLVSLGIDEIDERLNVLHTSELLTIVGASKAGKTRLAKHIDYRLIVAGFNVLICQLEGTTDEVDAMLLSKHIFETKGIYITDSDILNKTYDIKHKKVVEERENDLFTNPAYGKFKYLPGPFYAETFIEEFKRLYEDWAPYHAIDFDNFNVIQSTMGKGRYERITDGVISFKQFIASWHNRGVLGIAPWQMASEAIKLIRNGAEIDTLAGADSSEGVKSSDISIGLVADQAQRDNNQATLLSIAGRRFPPFAEFDCLALRGVSTFASLPESSRR